LAQTLALTLSTFSTTFIPFQIASPACTELEVVMLDWLGKMLDLPAEFLACSGGKGGGVIQGTASEATLVALLGAKAKALRTARESQPDEPEALLTSKLVGYCSGRYKNIPSSLFEDKIRESQTKV